MSFEIIKLKTKDDWEITGDYYAPDNAFGTSVLMLHMMPANRKSFSEIAVALLRIGFSGLAIDLRGHGESKGGPDGYKAFSDKEHQDSIYDVVSAADFLKTKGAKKIFIIGASIGANLALQYLSMEPAVKAAVLLSPGLNYKGLMIDVFVKNVGTGKAIYFVASEGDKYSMESTRSLYDMTPDDVKKDIMAFDRGGHGTNLFDSHPELINDIVLWFKNL